jgi:hypothetical protein
MPKFEFTSPEGKTFEMEGPEGSTKEQAFQKFKELKPELFGSPKPQAQKQDYSFTKRFGETFDPVKAITEEGLIPQAYGAAKKFVTGEKPPKADEKPEKEIGFKESLGKLKNFAVKDPGAFTATLANALVADPELLLLPELLPARLISAAGKTGGILKTADAATQAAAISAAQSTARQLNERGTVDWNIVKQEAKTAAALGGATRGVAEAARYVAPGAKSTSEGTQRLMQESREAGYTLPAGKLSPVFEVIDKYYKTPLTEKNAERFYRDITKETGTTVSEINPQSMLKVKTNLDADLANALGNQTINIPPQISQPLRQNLGYQRGVIGQALNDIDAGIPISGPAWHEVRKQLGQRLTGSQGPQLSDLKALQQDWDSIASQSLTSKAKTDFDTWKSRYTAYSDIMDAAGSNPTARNAYLNGELNPRDLFNAISQRRENEAMLQAPTARAQTKTAALAEGLGLLGKEPQKTELFGTTAKLASAIPSKLAQVLGYSPLGQELLYRGVPRLGIAPELAAGLEKEAK